MSTVFGRSASMHRDRLIVGDYGDEDPFNPFDPGRAYVFEHNGDQWVEAAILNVPDLLAPALLGWSVAIEGDTAVASAPWTQYRNGEVFIFRRSNGPLGEPLWSLEANIKPDYGAAPFLFGYSVAIDGGVLAISGIERQGTPDGWVELHARINGAWHLLHTIIAPDGRSADRFGFSVAVSRGRLLVGAPFHQNTQGGEGAAYLFVKTDEGWVLEKKFSVPGLPTGSRFGNVVALDGDTAVIGTPYSPGSGPKVWIHRLTEGEWLLEGTLRRPLDNSYTESDFARSLAISGDTLVVGAPYADLRGGAYFYRRINGAWLPFGRVRFDEVSSNDVYVGDLAHAVAVSGDQAVATSSYTVTSDPLMLTCSILPVSLDRDILGFTRHPSEAVAEPGDPAVFEAAVSGPDGITFRWLKNGVPIEDNARIRGAATPSLSFSTTTIEDSAFYSLLVASPECGSVVSRPALLNLGACIEVSAAPAASALRGGDPLVLSITAGGLLPLRYQWSVNGQDLRDDGRISGSQSATLVIDPTIPADAGTYRVIISSQCGAFTSAPAAVTFQPCVGIVDQPASVQTYIGDTVRFEAAASSHLPLTYRWRKGTFLLTDGGRISGSHSPLLTITGAQESDAAEYSCTISCEFNQRATQPAVLTLVPANCLGDGSGDRRVNFVDIAMALEYWGFNYRPGTGWGDANRDGIVDFRDISMVMGRFGAVCP